MNEMQVPSPVSDTSEVSLDDLFARLRLMREPSDDT